MAVVWMCGFESGLDRDSYAASGWNVGSCHNDTPRYGAAVMQPASGFGGGRYGAGYVNWNFNYMGPRYNATNGIGGPYPEFVWHMAYNRTGNCGGHSSARLFSGHATPANTEQIKVLWTPDNNSTPTLALYINGVLEATSTTTFPGGTGWHRLVITADGINGNYVVYVDGTPEITVTGGTAFSVPAGIDAVLFGAMPRDGHWSYIDHLVLFDNITADSPTAFGEIYIQGLLPNADDTDGAWVRSDNSTQTDIYEMIDDNSAVDYIQTTTNPDEFRVGVESRADIDAAWAPAAVHAVQTLNLPKASGSITQGEAKVEIAATTYTGPANALSTVSTHQWHLEEWPGGATVADLDTIKVGLKVS